MRRTSATMDPNVVHAFTTSAALDCGDRNPQKVGGWASRRGQERHPVRASRNREAVVFDHEDHRKLSSNGFTQGFEKLALLARAISSSADDDKVRIGSPFDFGGSNTDRMQRVVAHGNRCAQNLVGAAANDVGQLATSTWGRGPAEGRREKRPRRHTAVNQQRLVAIVGRNPVVRRQMRTEGSDRVRAPRRGYERRPRRAERSQLRDDRPVGRSPWRGRRQGASIGQAVAGPVIHSAHRRGHDWDRRFACGTGCLPFPPSTP